MKDQPGGQDQGLVSRMPNYGLDPRPPINGFGPTPQETDPKYRIPIAEEFEDIQTWIGPGELEPIIGVRKKK